MLQCFGFSPSTTEFLWKYFFYPAPKFFLFPFGIATATWLFIKNALCDVMRNRSLRRWGLSESPVSIIICSSFPQGWFKVLLFKSCAALSTATGYFPSLLVERYRMLNIWRDICDNISPLITHFLFFFLCCPVCSQISQMLGNELKFAVREPIGLRWDFECSLTSQQSLARFCFHLF